MRWLPLLLLVLVACQHHGQKRPAGDQDTVIAKRLFNTRQPFDTSRCATYSVLIGGDSTGFQFTACESLNSWWPGRVHLELYSRYKVPVSYRQELAYLRRVLPVAAHDFNFDSLRNMQLGGLAEHPDLSVAMTNQYLKRFSSTRWPGPEQIDDFLSQSRAATDMDTLLAPYGLKVTSVGAEKLMWLPKALLSRAGMELDTALIPDRVLDCMGLSISVGRK